MAKGFKHGGGGGGSDLNFRVVGSPEQPSVPRENDIWVILDYGDVVVHVFQTEYREFYRLEDLWADAPCVEYRDEPQQQETPSAKKTKAGSKVRATAKKVRKVEE